MRDLRLFSDVDRVDATPSGYAESTYEFLDRRAGEGWGRVRRLIESWFELAPEPAKVDLYGRLRSGSVVDFRSAFFELYCMALLRRGGWELESHPELVDLPTHPDLRATRGDDVLFLEVTTTATSQRDAGAERRLNVVLDEIDKRVPIDRFMLGVEVVGIGTSMPSVSRISDRLGRWMAGLDADALLASAPGGDYETLHWQWEQWSLVFEAYPLQADRRGPGGRIIGTTMPSEADIIDDVTALRRKMRQKAKAYGDLGASFAVAVDSVSTYTTDSDVISALYGTNAVSYYENAGPGAPAPTQTRLPDGLIYGPDGPRRCHVSAILTTCLLEPWTVTSTTPTWWSHPDARYPLQAPADVLRQAALNPARGLIEYVEPHISAGRFFELSDSWPDLLSR